MAAHTVVKAVAMIPVTDRALAHVMQAATLVTAITLVLELALAVAKAVAKALAQIAVII